MSGEKEPGTGFEEIFRKHMGLGLEGKLGGGGGAGERVKAKPNPS